MVSAPPASTATAGEQGAGPASCGHQGHQEGTFHTDCETGSVPEPREARLPDVGQLRAEGAEDREMGQREQSRAGWGAPGVRGPVTPSTLTAHKAGLRPPATRTRGRRGAQSHSGHWPSKTRARGWGPGQPGGWWAGRTAGPSPGQGTVAGVAGLPGQVGPAWQGSWGGRQGGVCSVWGKASAFPAAGLLTDPGRREEARQRPGGLAVVLDSPPPPQARRPASDLPQGPPRA